MTRKKCPGSITCRCGKVFVPLQPPHEARRKLCLTCTKQQQVDAMICRLCENCATVNA